MARPPRQVGRTRGSERMSRTIADSPLVAAALLVGSPEDVNADRDTGPHGAALVRQKQREVLGMYWQLGELWYTGNFFKQALSRVRLRIATLDDDGSRVPVYEEGKVREGIDSTKAKAAVDALREMRPYVGTQQQLMGQAGLNLGLVGECHLVGRDMAAAKFGLKRAYDIRSVLEFFPSGDGFRYVRAPGEMGEELARDAVHAVRVWNPDAAFGDLADAAPMALRDIMEELHLLTQQVKGEALSRMSTNGVLLVADELDDPDSEDASENDEAGDAFTRDIIRHASAAIADKASAAGVLPYIMRVPAQFIKDKAAIEFVAFHRESDDQAMKKRTEAVHRFAQGMDLPVEVVEGHMSTTFANAAQIDEDLYKVHIEPKCELLVNAFTTGYLWPRLNDDMFVIDYDASELVSQPDRSAEYAEAHKDFVISDAARRRAIGASEEDAPDDDEIQARIAIAQAIRVNTRVAATEEQVQAVDDEAAGGNEVIPPTPAAAAPPVPPAAGVAASAMMQGVIEATVNRSVFWTARRLRARVNRTPETRDRFANATDTDMAIELGEPVVDRLVPNRWRDEFDEGVRYLTQNLELTASEALAVRAEMERLADARLFTPSSDRAKYRMPRIAGDGPPVLVNA